MARGITPGKNGHVDQWHHEIKDDHGNLKNPVGTRKHHVGREEFHKDYSNVRRAGSSDRAEAHKKAAAAHAKVQTLKGKNLHADHPLVHAAMAATKKAEAADHRHLQAKIQKGIENHKKMMKAAANPKHPDHKKAKDHMDDFHKTRQAAADPNHPAHRAYKIWKKAEPERYGDHLAKIKESLEEGTQSADKKPELYTGPDGKRKVRMVPVDRDVDNQQHERREAASKRSKKMAAEELTKALEMMKRSLIKQAEEAKPFEMEESATSMRNMKLMTKIKRSGAVKDGSMAKKTLEPLRKAGNAKADAEAGERAAMMKKTGGNPFKKVDEVLDTPDKMINYKNRAKYSRDKASNSQAAHAMRGTDGSKDKDTERKRNRGLATLDKVAAKKMRKALTQETKGAPKGYHFTRSGQLKKGDAGADGPGGKKLRSDPLDKQRSKIPPLPEGYSPDTDPRAQQMKRISTSDKEKLLKIRQMLDKEKMNKEEKDTHVTKDGRTVKKGLWYYMNKRKKAGTSRPKSAGTVSPEAMKKSQK